MNSKNLLQAQQGFRQKEQTLNSGYLVLIDTQILHFNSQKEWETVKTNHPRHNYQFLTTNIEKWNKRFEKDPVL